jgi:lipoprotein-anchoring transpeptidase ErfK/SrfK
MRKVHAMNRYLGQYALGAVLAFALAIFSGNAEASVKVVIDLSDQTMTVKSGNSFTAKKWKVSTARKGYRTPTGNHTPYLMNERHFSSLYNNAPMPYSIFFKGNYAIHGTDALKSLGNPASHGCVRLHPDNARLLFEMVEQAGMQNTVITVVP